MFLCLLSCPVFTVAAVPVELTSFSKSFIKLMHIQFMFSLVQIAIWRFKTRHYIQWLISEPCFQSVAKYCYNDIISTRWQHSCPRNFSLILPQWDGFEAHHSSSYLSMLDCCNALFTCQNNWVLEQLQIIKNSEARWMKTKIYLHITPVQASLHCCSIRIQFFICLISFGIFIGWHLGASLSSFYINIQAVLRSTSFGLLRIPESKQGLAVLASRLRTPIQSIPWAYRIL